ncbi:MAG: M1 family metallopeptidase [Flavobacteriaceae bacterium]|nr:M1 family metallopeptidase [Flavobacteriaceae bacterium]
MANKTIFLLMFLCSLIAEGQESSVYRETKETVTDLEHTKLKVSFNFENSTMDGEAWITASPHFYATDKIILDAKSFIIHSVKVNNVIRTYTNSGTQLIIDLGKLYLRTESYEVYIKYTAQPEKVTQQGSAAIKDAKGLYFIDPKEEDPNKPTQIWTQGETESSSCWFPTIDAPNQKTSQEIYMTVPSKFMTLSNGTLISKIENGDGSRTDYWKMDQKHAPYLFFMGVGEFSVIKDLWKGKEVNYYVEKEYEAVARDIFGKTPQMLDFFSKITGIPYPWDKYSQIVMRDYVSGAMENTTAVIHAADAQQTKGQLVDKNIWENTIAHELFHHWFGDLVTTESWSNLTVNESFATYGEYLWLEHAYGKEIADEHLYATKNIYFSSGKEALDLVRFNYPHREEMFDPVSYHKGSIILHMLRRYIGDDAFFASLKVYLTDNKYGVAEAHQLRMAFEKVTGKDLNWFFNQWYFGNGHIKLKVSYDYNIRNKTVIVTLKQEGEIFKFPLTIDVYSEKGKERYDVWITDKEHSFTYPYREFPKLIQVGARHDLLAEITVKKSLENYLFQYKNATDFVDKLEAIEYLSAKQDQKIVFNTMVQALSDSNASIQIKALNAIDLFNKYNKKATIKKIEYLAMKSKNTLVKAAAIQVLGKLVNPIYAPVFKRGIDGVSFAVTGKSLVALYRIDKEAALLKVNSLGEKQQSELASPLTNMYIMAQDKSKLSFIANYVLEGMFLNQDPEIQAKYGEAFRWIAESDNAIAIQIVTDKFIEYGHTYKQYNFDKLAINMLNRMVQIQEERNNIQKTKLIKIIKLGLSKLL